MKLFIYAAEVELDDYSLLLLGSGSGGGNTSSSSCQFLSQVLVLPPPGSSPTSCAEVEVTLKHSGGEANKEKSKRFIDVLVAGLARFSPIPSL
jgi:hypothetical protein